jgi:hypothetical protein
MVETGILREVYAEDEEERTYQPALDTHKITVGMVIGRIDKQGTEEFLQAVSPQMHKFWQSYLRMKDAHKTLDAVLVKEL